MEEAKNQAEALLQQSPAEMLEHLAFMDLLFSPLTNKTTGELWPAGSTNEAGPEYLPVWLNLTQKRYEFKRGNHYVATEIKALCDQLGVWPPLEILDWMSSNHERVGSKSEKRARKKELDKRNFRAEYLKLLAVFGIPPVEAVGWMQQRLEADGVVNEKGRPFTDDTIKSYIEHEAARIERDSYVLSASRNDGSHDLTIEERNEWQHILLNRYPEEIKDYWVKINAHCIK